MMGDKSLKEIRADLCEHLGIPDEELNAWMHRTFDQPRPKRKVRAESELQELLRELEAAVATLENKPARAVRKTPKSHAKRRKQTPKAM
jgi:hypothetical protein